MSRGELLTVIIAENAPVIAAGIAACLDRISSPRCRVITVDSMPALVRHVKDNPTAVILADPGFCGVFNPECVRNLTTPSPKVIAIETSSLTRSTRALFDGSFPVLDDLDSLAGRLQRLACPADTDAADRKEQLSTREKEIVVNVVKGFTNKEIADKLYLSVHTVVTHRRNIARKLEIHSATGLTIYAIVNGLVDLGDIKL